MFRFGKPSRPVRAGKAHPVASLLVGIAWLVLVVRVLMPAEVPADPVRQSYRDLAWDCFWQRDYSNAIAHFNQAIRLDPRDVWCWNCRALAEENVGDLAGALADFRMAARINPNYADVFVNCGELLQHQPNKLGIAIADYTQAIRLEPANPRPYILRAAACLEATNSDQALSDYNQAIQLQPTNDLYWFDRGDLNERLNHFDAAISDYTVCLQLQPTNALYYLRRARGREMAGRVRARPGEPPTLTGALDPAWQDLRRAAELDSSKLSCLGDFEYRHGLYDDARADYTAYLQAHPEEDLAWIARVFRARAGEWAARNDAQPRDREKQDATLALALADWNQLAAAETNPANQWRWRCERGGFYARNNQFTNALADYQQAVELAPRPETFSRLALFLATCPDPAFRNGTQALDYAQQAYEPGHPQNDLVLAGLAAAHAETGDYEQAVKFQKMALKVMETRQQQLESSGLGYMGCLDSFQREMVDRLAHYELKTPCHKVMGMME